MKEERKKKPQGKIIISESATQGSHKKGKFAVSLGKCRCSDSRQQLQYLGVLGELPCFHGLWCMNYVVAADAQSRVSAG